MPDWSKVGSSNGEGDGRVLTATFASQTHFEHLGVVVGGIALWSALYLGVLIVVASSLEVGIQETSAALAARRTAFLWANVGCGLYFGAAVVRGFGGPVLNIVYAAVLMAINPELTHVVLGTTPEPLVSPYGGTFFVSPRGFDVAPLLLSGLFALVGVVILWFLTICRGAERRRRWFDRHWPEDWRESEDRPS